MVRPILDINTQNKVLVLGGTVILVAVQLISLIKVSASDDFLETLLQDIDADQLPTHYGGTGVDEDGDPKCSKHVAHSFLYFRLKFHSEMLFIRFAMVEMCLWNCITKDQKLPKKI